MFGLGGVLLGVLCIRVVLSEESEIALDNVAVEYDTFIPIRAVPVKDQFDWRLLQKFTSAKGHKNVILSPLSLKLVLALLYEGAGGLTEAEFQHVLHFPANKTSIRQEFSDLLDTLVVKRESYIINVGTQLFLDSRLAPLPRFQTIAQHSYHTDVTKTNFSNPLEASTNINTWVEFLTNGRIKSFVRAEDIEDAVLLAANAIYFKGMWSIPFPKNESFTAGFHAYGNQIVQLSYMKQTNKFYYYDSKTLDSEILRIPYKGGKFALYIILPNSRNGLSHLINNLDFMAITLGVGSLDLKPVTVILPKFRFDFQTRYSRVLREFGFDTLFTGGASFPNIVRDQEGQLVVTDILQKSGIDVNEEGSVIYTTTQVTIGNKFGGEPVTTFNASKPFLFFIQEEITQNILFIGKIENPLDTDAVALQPKYGEGDSSPPVVPSSTPSRFPATPVLGSLTSQFDLELLKNSIGTSKNVFISPSSVKVSLAMLAEAASPATAAEIYVALGLSPTQENYNYIIQSLVSELSETHPSAASSSSSVLEFQNGLFVSDKETVNEQYRSAVGRYYRAFIKQLNYQNKERAALAINTFVNNATSGLIPTILSAEEIDPNTQVILTNALYFKAAWETVFDKKWTKSAPFDTARGCVPVSLMQLLDQFEYIETQNAQIVKINYAGDTRAMLLVLPTENSDISAALGDIESYQSFGQLVSSLKKTDIELLLPRFDIEYGFDLVGTLQKMNIRQVFDANSSLPKLFKGGKLGTVDSFIHKAKVEVNEEGTKAAAISLVSVIPLMGMSVTKVRADHPFAFFIFNTRTNTILFEGILNEPQENSKVSHSESKTRNPCTTSYAHAVNNQLPTQIPDEVYRRTAQNANRF